MSLTKMRRVKTSACVVSLAIVALIATSLELARAASIRNCGDSEPTSVLRVGTKPVRPFSFRNDNGRWTGFSWDFFESLVFPAAREYGLNESSICVVELANNEAIIDAIVAGNVTTGHAALTKTAARERRVDFSNTWFVTGFRVLTRAQDDFVATFVESAELVGAVVGLFLANVVLMVIAGALALPVLENFSPGPYPPWDDETVVSEIVGAAAFTMGAMFGATQRGPTGKFSRPVANGCGALGVMLMAIFTAIMTFAISSTGGTDAVKSVDDLAGRSVVIPRASTASQWAAKSPVGMKVTYVDTLEDGFELMRTNEAFSMIYDEGPLYDFVNRELKAGSTVKYRVVGPLFEEQQYGTAFAEGDARLESINKAILDTWETDAFAQIGAQWFGETTEVDVIENSNSQLFVLLIVGAIIVGLALLLFLAHQAYELYLRATGIERPPSIKKRGAVSEAIVDMAEQAERLNGVVRSLSDSELIFAIANLVAANAQMYGAWNKERAKKRGDASVSSGASGGAGAAAPKDSSAGVRGRADARAAAAHAV